MKLAILIGVLLVFSLFSQTVSATCVMAAPTITPSEVTVEGLPSETKVISITLQNNDNVNCTAASYTYQAKNSDRWSSSITGGSPYSIQNGSNTTINITITPENDIEDGDYYTIPIFVHSSNSSLNVSGKFTYRVRQPTSCAKGTHTIELVDRAHSGNPGSSQTYQVKINNTDKDCNSLYYNVTAAIVNAPSSGTFTMHHPVIQKIRPGTQGTFSVTVASDQNVPPATYTIRFSANSINKQLTTDGTFAISPTAAQTFTLHKGLNLMSSQTDLGITMSRIRDNCGQKSIAYYFDMLNWKYREAKLLLPYIGYWVYVPADCSFAADTNASMGTSISMIKINTNTKGWVLISGEGPLSTIKGSCVFNESTSPWYYDTPAGVYKNEGSLTLKKAYWAKLNSSCTWEQKTDKVKVPSVSCSRSDAGSLTIQFTVNNKLDTEITANSITASLKHPDFAMAHAVTHAAILPQESKVITNKLTPQGTAVLTGGYYTHDYVIGGQTVRVSALCPNAPNE